LKRGGVSRRTKKTNIWTAERALLIGHEHLKKTTPVDSSRSETKEREISRGFPRDEERRTAMLGQFFKNFQGPFLELDRKQKRERKGAKDQRSVDHQGTGEPRKYSSILRVL